MPFNNSEGRLMEYIFANYSPYVRPVVHNQDPVVVRFGVMLNQIIDLVRCKMPKLG